MGEEKLNRLNTINNSLINLKKNEIDIKAKMQDLNGEGINRYDIDHEQTSKATSSQDLEEEHEPLLQK